MNNEQLDIFLDELKELTDIESPTNDINGVNQVAEWFIKKRKHRDYNINEFP